MNIKVRPFISSLVLVFSAAIIGSLFTTPSIDSWYNTLNKPWFNPPNWLFAPVWTTLYFLMAIALYLVWTKPQRSTNRRHAIQLFIWQLILNTIWSIIFFGLQQPGLALFEVIILWIAILMTIIYFYRINWISSWLLLPYLLWVSFATVLNGAIFWLNR